MTLANADGDKPNIRRLNKLPLYIAIGVVAVFIVAVVWGLATRGLIGGGKTKAEVATGASANNYAEQLKRGVADGVVDQPRAELVLPAMAVEKTEEPKAINPFASRPRPQARTDGLEEEEVWRARIKREQEEEQIRQVHRNQMSKIEAHDKAYDSPMVVNISALQNSQGPATQGAGNSAAGSRSDLTDLYSAALRAQNGQQLDPNNQIGKDQFLNQQMTKAGYLGTRVVPQQSPFELKRGSVIPATLISGVNSDLPGRLSAQVSQNVYDSATGHRLLIPQGAKLFGRYDSKISFGQSRVLVVWTDLIFPNGSTLQLGGMAGMDMEGYGGFTDQVDNKYFQIFGSAVMVAMIGAGMDMAIPQSNTNSNPYNQTNSASDSARRSFAETFGRVAERTISKNMDVQPTLTIRPGYVFNVMVEQDIVFPGGYR